MFCQKCGTEGVEGEFCKKCGIKLGNMTISQQPQTIYIQQTPEPIKMNDGTASLILGIIGLFAWIIPIAGIIIGTCGARSGVQSNKQNLNGKATTGIILSTISIIASFLWIIIGLTSYFGGIY